MPSQRTSERLAPLEPRPRRETPWVVGLATSEEVRRKRVNPGIRRRRSSMSAPGDCAMASESRTVSGGGDSAVMFSDTVIEVWTGSGGAAAGVWPGAGSGEATRMQNTSGAPSQLVEAARLRDKDDSVSLRRTV